jgi:endonuclease YncB( thermonuclease family)
MNWILFVTLCFNSIIFSDAVAEEFKAKVLFVMDGDTVLVLHNRQKIKIRLANIDAPEKAQAFGRQARLSLFALVQRKQVRIQPQATDKYGRTVALLWLDQQNINEEQVRRGMAWAYFHPEHRYVELQHEAQQARRGLWQQTRPVEPSQWRKSHTTNGNKWVGTPTKSFCSATVSNMRCGKKTHCNQMISCDEAYYYLNACGIKSLDKNSDGIPCIALCLPSVH